MKSTSRQVPKKIQEDESKGLTKAISYSATFFGGMVFLAVLIGIGAVPRQLQLGPLVIDLPAQVITTTPQPPKIETVVVTVPPVIQTTVPQPARIETVVVTSPPIPTEQVKLSDECRDFGVAIESAKQTSDSNYKELRDLLARSPDEILAGLGRELPDGELLAQIVENKLCTR